MGKYYDPFEYCAPTEEPIPGEVANAAEAIGFVTMNFAELDDRLSRSIAFLIGNTEEVGAIITAELAFKQKLHVLSSLFRSVRPGSAYHAQMDELLGRLKAAEGLRNQVTHSSWQRSLDDGEGIVRHKFTAKMQEGLKKQEQTLTPLQIHGLGGHFGYLSHCLDELLYVEFGSEYGEP
jgi:hypothetical protein